MFATAGLVCSCKTTVGTSAPLAAGNPDGAKAPASAEMRYLDIRVRSSGTTDEGRLVAAELERAVRDALAANGVPVKGEQPDIELTMAVEALPFDQSGNFYVYQVHAQAAEKTMTSPVKSLAVRRFDVRSDRKLDKKEALLDAADKLAAAAAEWSLEMLDPAKSELLANDLTIEVPWYRTRREQSAYAQGFVEQVSELSGMITCRLIAQDYANKTMVFRVVYLRDSYPAGLLNYLTSLGSLGITPKR